MKLIVMTKPDQICLGKLWLDSDVSFFLSQRGDEFLIELPQDCQNFYHLLFISKTGG